MIPRHVLQRKVDEWLHEDCPTLIYDEELLGTEVANAEKRATLWCKSRSKAVLAGCDVFEAVFDAVDCSVEWLAKDGDVLDGLQKGSPQKVATVSGAAKNILLAERVALNMLARMSGIATKCRKMVKIAAEHGFDGALAGTRKTTPGMRLFEKRAMRIGGFDTHRETLADTILVKDNHKFARGALWTGSDRRSFPALRRIEAECATLQEALDALKWGVDAVMFDNANPADLSGLTADLASVKQRFPNCKIEVSGGVTEANIGAFVDALTPHIDIVSVGEVTQNFACIDFSLKINK